MSAMPGSLDYLYYNGILDHIPYEAYEMNPRFVARQSQIASNQLEQKYANQYLNTAQQGALYKNSIVPHDTFIKNNIPKNYSIIQHSYNDEFGVGRSANYKNMLWDEGLTSYRQSIIDAANETKDGVAATPTWAKGILGLGIFAATICCLIKKRKP